MKSSRQDLYRQVIQQVGFLLQDEAPALHADAISAAARALILTFTDHGWTTQFDLQVIDALHGIVDASSSTTIH